MDIYDPSTTAIAVEALGRIVKVEGPIVEALALRRVAQWFGVQRITERFRERFAHIRTAALQSQPIKAHETVFWPVDLDPSDYATVRIPGAEDDDCRNLEHVPLIERVNAVTHVLNEQFGLPREDLERETAKLLGVGRLTPRVRELIGGAVDSAIAQGRAESRDGQVCIPASGPRHK